MYFRFDDVCTNADMALINDMTDFLFDRFPNCSVLWGVSPLLHNMTKFEDKRKQRIFPEIFNAYSDHRIFFNVDIAGIPNLRPDVEMAGHGLIHVDHRLLTREQQEMSILISASLVKSKIFIPPFNKWNKDTESICAEHNIELIKFEDGWLSMEHNRFNRYHNKWYLHAREFSLNSFKAWFNE